MTSLMSSLAISWIEQYPKIPKSWVLTFISVTIWRYWHDSYASCGFQLVSFPGSQGLQLQGALHSPNGSLIGLLKNKVTLQSFYWIEPEGYISEIGSCLEFLPLEFSRLLFQKFLIPKWGTFWSPLFHLMFSSKTFFFSNCILGFVFCLSSPFILVYFLEVLFFFSWASHHHSVFSHYWQSWWQKYNT